MAGEWQGYHRIRVGDLRVIFWIDKNDKVIYIDYIGARGDVYKISLIFGALVAHAEKKDKRFTPRNKWMRIGLLLKEEKA